MGSPVDELPRHLPLSLHHANSRSELSVSELSLSDLVEGRSSTASRKPSPAPSTPVGETTWGADRWDEGVTEPIKPAGLYVKNVVYAGRALAEWAQVVFECNNFVERRRDEGVTNPWDMEIPILGVEGFRKLGG
jgi:hypothetical protein